MSIKAFIRKVCVQDAVYWEYTGPDGMGGSEYAPALEIKVRWDDKLNVASDSRGKEIISHAQILTPDDLKEQSMVWLGKLEDLPPNPDPHELTDSSEILAMDRHPLFRSRTLDVFVAYLGSRRV